MRVVQMTYSSTWRYPADAWQWAKGSIAAYGDLVKTEDGKLTKEVMNLLVTVLEPLQGWPVEGSGWNMTGLNQYADQLLSGENPSGFEYVYGERLRTYPDTEGNYAIDQIDFCIENLKRSKNSRRSVAITWVPDWDDHGKEVPCLQLLDFLIRDGKLHCTAFFRSHDILRAWPCNVYGIGRLMQHVANEINVPVGSLTTVSGSAHIYQ